ncbi:MAG: FumA C-terminus/TtdB family hydratase beta subunit [Armatimonadetes bacterium]|nr:FumA C-terminus/TtdB family hydratase beta subunit [Armatimonadota bacterium]
MSKEYHFTLPIEDKEVRRLETGDIVYLTGTCYTMRDMGHRRSIEILQQEEALPFNLAKGALWHCGPIVKKEGETWRVVSAGSTTSSRFTSLGAELIRQVKVRFTIGKGTMGQEAVKAMQETGACYLNSVGGCAALYAEQIKNVKMVFWTDLGLPEAIWVLEVENLGPLVVGIDSHGNSLYERIRNNLEKHLQEIYAGSGLKGGYKNFTYLPKRVPGRTVGCFF